MFQNSNVHQKFIYLLPAFILHVFAFDFHRYMLKCVKAINDNRGQKKIFKNNIINNSDTNRPDYSIY